MGNTTATILIVDDEALNRTILESMLSRVGYVTQCAEGGQQALAAIAISAPDLIILDVCMPGMDGFDVAKALKANPATSNIPIIMATANADRESRLAGLQAGVEEFVTKPVDMTELWLRVRNLLRLKEFGDFFQNHSQVLEHQVQARTADLQSFRTAMDVSADGIVLIDRASMQFTEVNKTICRMLGYSRAEMMELGPITLGGIDADSLGVAYDAVIADPGKNHLMELALHCRDGSRLSVEVNRQAQQSVNGWTIVCVARDISRRKAAEQQLHFLAHYDALTELPNRTLFYETLRKTLVQAASTDWQVAVLFIDLDYFKVVNDSFGHACGDELLRQFSQRLVQCVRVRDTVGRLSGDEFAVILTLQERGQHGVVRVVDKIREALNQPFDLDGHEVSVSASIGATLHPDDASDPATLIKFADTAMYQAKHAGRDGYRFFTAQMNIEAEARRNLESALKKAVIQDEFTLVYQPKLDVKTGQFAGCEALLRWRRPGYGVVSPSDFISALEDTGLIIGVGSWVIAAVCRQIAVWQKRGLTLGPVSVNVSGRQFLEGDIEGCVRDELRQHNIPASCLELEITESVLMTNFERVNQAIAGIRQNGVRVSIDDFGTGYSSLAYLRRFPVDKLKIDSSFVQDAMLDPGAAAIVKAIVSMAHSLNLAVIAEGVETEDQKLFLGTQQCDEIQGYWYSRPLPAHDLEEWLKTAS